MTNSPITIRSATPGDEGLILEFIRGLAGYEKLAHEVVATEADVSALLFGERPYAEAVIGCVDGSPQGFALYCHNVSTFRCKPGIYLEDLFVTPEARGCGLGKALFEHVANVAVERGCARYEWAVLDWNTPSQEFYKRYGARVMEDWQLWRLDGNALVTAGKG